MIRSERGSALPAVLGVLLVLGILAAVVWSTSNHVRQSTSSDRAGKRAFQAAEAGLHVAAYRLNKVAPQASQCLTDQPVSPSGGDCPLSATENAGNGEGFRYAVTQVLASGSTQCDLPSTADFTTNDYRCITAIGTASGATRRVQAIVSSPRTQGKWAVNGVLGLSGVTESGTASINGDLASNGQLKFSGSTLPTQPVLLGPTGSVNPTSVPYTRKATNFTAPVDSAAFVATGGDTRDPSKVAQNDNARLYPLPTNVTLSSGRELGATNTVGTAGSPWIIPGGTYNVCNVSFGNKTYIQLAAGAQVHLYIDSPNRPGSGCPSGSGNFSATNQFFLTNPSNDPANLQIDVYGGSGTTFKVSNQATLYALIYAPNTDFTSTGVGAFVGGIVANTVTTSNTFNVTGAVPPSLMTGTRAYGAQTWMECVPKASPSAPGTGC